MATLPDGARLEPGNGGLQRLVLSSPASEAHVYLHGGHLTHYQPAGERPVLWMSEHSQFALGKPIRGGVPICFPWFGPRPDDPAAPLHGFARLVDWSLVSVERDADGGLVAALELRSDASTQRFLPQSFALRLVVAAGRSLRMSLRVRNEGGQPLVCTEAQHTYFAVGDVRRASVRGLERGRYVDKADGGAVKVMGDEALTVTGETDRVFTRHAGELAIEDRAWGRRIRIRREGSATAVVWNPWQAKARAMPDFGDEEWTQMLCVESANALDDALTLAPGGSHELVTTIAVEPA